LEKRKGDVALSPGAFLKHSKKVAAFELRIGIERTDLSLDHTKDIFTMTTLPSTIPCGSASASVSKTPTSGLIASLHEMAQIHDQREDLGNKAFNNNIDIDDSSVNESNDGEVHHCRSTSSGEWHSEVGDNSCNSNRREVLASNETRVVTKLKLLVFGSLFFSMVAVVLGAYYLTLQAEITSFELHFHDDANKILGNIGQNLQRSMEASDAFITSITSYAANTNQTWPFVVIPDFSVRAEKIRSLCGGIYAATYNVVNNEQRKEWENFTATVGKDMADSAIAAIADYNVMDWPVTPNYTEWNVIYDYGEHDKPNKVSAKQRIPVKFVSIHPLTHLLMI
jgi:hypothetical protein